MSLKMQSDRPVFNKGPYKKQFTTATNESIAERQETGQTLISLLTSHHPGRSAFGSEGGMSYANKLQTKKYTSKLNS